MVIQKEDWKTHAVYLEKSVVEKARKKMRFIGAKLSPTINNLLKVWIEFPEEIRQKLEIIEKQKIGE